MSKIQTYIYIYIYIYIKKKIIQTYLILVHQLLSLEWTKNSKTNVIYSKIHPTKLQ